MAQLWMVNNTIATLSTTPVARVRSAPSPPPTLQTMKLTSLIALFALSLAGVEAIGPDDHMHYKGSFHAPHKLELTKMGINRVSHCSSSANALPTEKVCVLWCPPDVPEKVKEECRCVEGYGGCRLDPPSCAELQCKCKEEYPPA